MAQSGYTPILIYASGTTGNAPSAANLTSSASGAELALNYFDGKLFYKDASGNVQVLATKGAAQNSISFGTTGLTPSTATQGAVTVAGTLVAANGGTGQSSYTTGDLLYASGTTALSKLGIGTNGYILTSNGTAPVWTAGSSISVNTATNLAGGAAGSVPYQSGAGATTFLSIGTANTVMTSSGTAPQWSSSLTLGGNLVVNGNTTLGDAAADTVTINGTITSNLIFTDNTYDIGASGATRPRSMFLGTNLTVGNNITVGTASGSEYIFKPGTDTATGVLRIQAGAGSAAFGGGLVLYSHSNATNPGWVIAGLSSGAAAKFAVNTWGTGGGTNVFTVGTTGLGSFNDSVAINGTATTWTNASALTVSDYVALGQRNIGNADGIFSWNAKWSGGSSGGGYTYLKAGDVASAIEQNGQFRFYTTASTGSAGGSISFSQRALIGNSGLTVNGAVEITATGVFPTTGFTYNSNGYLYTMGGSAGVITQIGAVNRLMIDASGRFGFSSAGTTADRLVDMSFQGAATSGANQFGMVLNPTYPTTVTASLFNLYSGPNLTAGTTVTSVYNLYLEGISAPGSTITNRYALYQAGSSDRNFFNGNVSIGTTAQEGKLTVATGNESSGQVQIAQFRTEATGSATYNAGVQIYGTASATGANRLISVILDPDGANAAGGDYVVFQKVGGNGDASLYNASNASFYFGTNTTNIIRLVGNNTLNLTGRRSNAYTMGNLQQWVGQVTSIANGGTFSLFEIAGIYDNLCYEIDVFVNSGGFFAGKYSGIFGYNGTAASYTASNYNAFVISKTGTLYNETMTITNNSGATVNNYNISVRVWGYNTAQSVSTGGADLITSSYLTRIE